MRVQALKDATINGQTIRAGQIIAVGSRQANKLIREGLVRALDSPDKKLETKSNHAPF